MRVPAWVPKTTVGWVVAVGVGTLLFLLAAVIQGVTFTPIPTRGEGNAEFLALLVAVIGGSWIGAQVSTHQLVRRDADGRAAMLADFAESTVAHAELDVQEARRVRAEPWYADAVVDLDEASRRWLAGGHMLRESILTVPNPYFVLPLDALVRWGFATEVEVREATRWATSTTPPVRWQNPALRDLLNVMGWTDTEAYARVGLLHWRTDSETPDPAKATVEAKVRLSGQIYDVPRPAALP